MLWRETTALGQVRTARRSHVEYQEETMAILLVRFLMHSREEDLEQTFYRSKGAMNEIFYEMIECFVKWASPLVLEFQKNIFEAKRSCMEEKLLRSVVVRLRIISGL
jgi:hypothetical protein